MRDVLEAANEAFPKARLAYNKEAVKALFQDLYEEIKHGDAEHQKWLYDKIQEFLNKTF